MNNLFTKYLIKFSGLFLSDKKEKNELTYWRIIKFFEKELNNNHYKNAFTKFFDLTDENYKSKKVLDIGCGPRGSLEWCKNGDELIGLDPLADDYLLLNNKIKTMKLIKGFSENIPFENSYFDIVSSFNSLDHVDNLEKTISEIKRVLKPGGYFLLITDCCHISTPTEPQTFGWEITEKLKPEFDIIFEKKLEKKGRKIFRNIERNVEYDFNNKTNRYGLLIAKFIKKNF